jgi:hypothetical protein
MVESSGRSSAHANVLDALEAIAMTSSPAVNRLNVAADATEEETAAAAAEGVTNDDTGATWQDLAIFLFGPNWLQQQQQQQQSAVSSMPQVPLGTGKLGPGEQNKASRQGWQAPYLDEVPSFPVASEKCANPHALPEAVSKSLHQYVLQDKEDMTTDEKELEDMPDQAFQIEWGSVPAVTEEDEKDSKPSATDEPPKKRVKLDVEGAAAAVASDVSSSFETRPAYVPSFMPPFPSAVSMGRAVVGADLGAPKEAPSVAKATNEKEALEVRSSLVRLAQHSYWGSGWDAPATSLKVPPGRRAAEASEAATSSSSAVVPVSRPSGARFGKILEGSMEPST